MEYNTSRDQMIIPEYGRNVQRMVDYLLTIEDREKRNQQARNLIEIIGNLNPNKVKESQDFRHKLWDHLYIMSDFKLEVDSPFPPPKPESLMEKPEEVPYPETSRNYRHYGNILKNMVKYLASLEPGEEKDALKAAVANQMKKTYLLWNKDHVEDEVILKEMKALAEGKLDLEDVSLADKKDLVTKGEQNQSGFKGKKKFKKRGKKRFKKK